MTTTDTKITDLTDPQWDAACTLLLGLHVGRFNRDVVVGFMRRRGRYRKRSKYGERQIPARCPSGTVKLSDESGTKGGEAMPKQSIAACPLCGNGYAPPSGRADRKADRTRCSSCGGVQTRRGLEVAMVNGTLGTEDGNCLPSAMCVGCGAFPCSATNGENSGYVICPACGGMGTGPDKIDGDGGDEGVYQDPCTTCDGAGRIGTPDDGSTS